MAFRFILVGAVAALGFDLPQGIDVDALAHSGQAWWHARVAEFEVRHGIVLVGVEGTSSPEQPADDVTLAPDADAAFATVIEDVVASFAVVGQSERVEEPEASPQPVAGVEDVAFGPELADALNRWADGLSEPAEPVTLAFEAGEIAFDSGFDLTDAPIIGFAGSAFAPSINTNLEVSALASSMDSSDGDAEYETGAESSASGGQRLVEAVQITGQALQAWLALVQPAVPSLPPPR